MFLHPSSLLGSKKLISWHSCTSKMLLQTLINTMPALARHVSAHNAEAVHISGRRQVAPFQHLCRMHSSSNKTSDQSATWQTCLYR